MSSAVTNYETSTAPRAGYPGTSALHRTGKLLSLPYSAAATLHVFFRVGVFALIALSYAACAGDDPGATTDDPVKNTLTKLGVDQSGGAREDADGNAYPPGYSPFGAQTTINKTNEIFTLGFKVEDPQRAESYLATSIAVTQVDLGVTEVLYTEESEPVWAQTQQGSRAFSQSMRSAVSADIDGDGLEEVVIVFVDITNAERDQELTVIIYDDAEATPAFSTTTKVLKLQPGIKDVRLAAGDFDGDGAEDIVIGLGLGETAQLLFAQSSAGDLVIDGSATKFFSASTSGWTLGFSMATGNLDYDRGKELAVVLNESGPNDGGVARYFIYDSADTVYAELDSAVVQGIDGSPYSAIVASVAMGDFDGDAVDEIVFGGLTGFTGNMCGTNGYLMLGLDDNLRGLAKVGTKYIERILDGCQDFSPWQLRWVHVNAVDLDGDRVDEMHANGMVFNNWNEAAPFSTLYTISDEEFFDGSYGWYARSTSVMVTGDVTGDGREDIVSYTQSTDSVRVFGEDQISGFGKLTTLGTEFLNAQYPINPILLPVNVDKDSLVLKYSDGEYKLVFTQPIVIAALAAPPCQNGIGQNTSACYTTFGKAESATIDKEQVLSVSASVSAGFKVTGGVLAQSELEVKATVSSKASKISGSSYSLTKSIVYTTGPLEDSVVFTTIPYDQYTYTVVSHPSPELIGRELVVSFPRSPITLIAERSFYNASVPSDALKIDETIFQHVPGDITTYLTRAQKNVIANGQGLEQGPQSVGQGTSATELGLDVGEAYTEGGALELGFEFSLQGTGATVLAGFTVGASVENSLRVTSGESTSYTGRIGSIEASSFARNIYSYGLFTYVKADPTTGQQFEVINYWVE